MAAIETVTLEVPDPTSADAFYSTAFALGPRVGVRASAAPTTGFRGFTLSLVVSQPSTVDSLIGTALDGGATTLKPAKKGFWGYGGVGVGHFEGDGRDGGGSRLDGGGGRAGHGRSLQSR